MTSSHLILLNELLLLVDMLFVHFRVQIERVVLIGKHAVFAGILDNATNNKQD